MSERLDGDGVRRVRDAGDVRCAASERCDAKGERMYVEVLDAD